MKLVSFKPEGYERNFGDALNSVIWDAFVPELAKADVTFCGIGTVLTESLPSDRPMIVFGSGVGYGHVPDLSGVDVRFVRGPKSSRAIGGVEYITDPAMLIGQLARRSNDPQHRISWLPHWSTISSDETLPDRLKAINVHVIDPRKDVNVVLDDIASSELLLAGALHGAVVADTLRIPWIPVYSSPFHLFKWWDWTASVGLMYDPADLNVLSINKVLETEMPLLSSDEMFSYNMRKLDREVAKLRRSL